MIRTRSNDLCININILYSYQMTEQEFLKLIASWLVTLEHSKASRKGFTEKHNADLLAVHILERITYAWSH